MKNPVRNIMAEDRFHAYNPEKHALWWDVEYRCVRGLTACTHPQQFEANHRSGFSPDDRRAVKLLFPKFMGLRVCRAAGEGKGA